MAGEPLVTIAAFAPQLQVISSKQRPRKLTIYGSNGAEYMFLLKVCQDDAHLKYRGWGIDQWLEGVSFHTAVLALHIPDSTLATRQYFPHTLQGHEDLRQDERVMQLFGLVNTMLANDRTTAERDLSIARCDFADPDPDPHFRSFFLLCRRL